MKLKQKKSFLYIVKKKSKFEDIIILNIFIKVWKIIKFRA